MARFQVARFIQLSARPGRLYLSGDILDGEIKIGMEVRVLLDSKLYWTVPVRGIEYVDHVDGHAEVALQLNFDSPDDEKAFQQLCRPGDEIDVDAPAPAETDDR